MNINKEGNTYTFGFAIAMVVVVGTLLSVAAISLKPMQKKNQKQEKMQAILKTIGVDCSRDEAEENFTNYVQSRLLLNFDAEIKSENSGPIDAQNKEDAFNVDITKEYKNSSLTTKDRGYPLYVCEKDGENYYVIPIIISFIYFIVHALSERQRILKIKKRCLLDHHDF